MAGGILVHTELDQNGVDEHSQKLLAKARELSGALGERTVAVVLADEGSERKRVIAEQVSADEVFFLQHPLLKWYNPELHGKIIVDLAKKMRPSTILIGHSYNGLDLGSILGFHFNVPVVSNCLEVSVEEGKGIVIVRPYYRGKLNGKIVASKNTPCILTLSKGINVPKFTNGSINPELHEIEFAIDGAAVRQRILEVVESSSTGVDLSKAETIVSVGRGIGDKSKVSIVQQLADAMGGVLGCSRPLVDMEWLPQERQVGLSGKTVAPKLYLACGISGAMEHQVGMKESGLIVALNQDPEAPIFALADFGIVGDLFEIVPLLTKAVLKKKQENSEKH
jgi:electron transfer flavoprotein alpha subunit